MKVTVHMRETLPLPPNLYEAILIADAVGKDGGQFLIFAGLIREWVGQLRTCSLDDGDTDLQNHTSDRQRFGDGSYEEWYGKNRTLFSLVDEKTGTLAAVCWFGPKPLGQKSMKHLSPDETEVGVRAGAEEWHTVSYRSYGAFRGKGLMKDFVRTCMGQYQKTFPRAKLWLIADAGNAASTALAEKLGFKVPAGAPGAPASVVMVKE